MWLWGRCFPFASRHLLVVCTQTYIFRCCILFEAVVCRLYEMLYPCICNVVISCWKSGAYGFVICRGGTDMCSVLGFGRKRPDLKQYRISGLTSGQRPIYILHPVLFTLHIRFMSSQTLQSLTKFILKSI